MRAAVLDELHLLESTVYRIQDGLGVGWWVSSRGRDAVQGPFPSAEDAVAAAERRMELDRATR